MSLGNARSLCLSSNVAESVDAHPLRFLAHVSVISYAMEAREGVVSVMPTYMLDTTGMAAILKTR